METEFFKQPNKTTKGLIEKKQLYDLEIFWRRKQKYGEKLEQYHANYSSAFILVQYGKLFPFSE